MFYMQKKDEFYLNEKQTKPNNLNDYETNEQNKVNEWMEKVSK